ncbi:SAM-dependent methyltransferase [Mycolicibacterium wolinskyi]|uniref:SAM-dependent methyltransferase n=1 Tax=Mycolicibacterium wolinskyi TaxID=59750 RepID=A0A1X2EUR2_9MYCO|nr:MULTISPECIES: SAM-dependent methyltransferase [Mycolicibacterium]MCV7287207.1 SAM-dependent methyltransferase [Mycolicibacterium wolinskyi]MCV7292700.1 SAM-dependent methyltransferase [Mycolicibacterium goodii]ORX09893.1 SAM-dependent methyltransferase [Mycolicibacterium wolinskyi]
MPESRVSARSDATAGGTRKKSPPRQHAAGLDSAIKLFEQAARTVPLPAAPYPIVIADYGAGSGHNSMRPIAAAVAALRGRTRPAQCVLVTHTDTAENDFTTMFRGLAEDPESYLRKDSATFTSAVGRSFYTQILPSNAVHLGWSAWALVRLGKVPMPIGDHIAVAYSGDDHTRAAYARQAAHDWHEFVAFRGRELSPGGRLVVMTMAVGDDGDFGYRPLFDAVMDTLQELVAERVVSADEVERMTLPIVGRRAADFAAPFAPSGRFEKLSISHLEVFDAEDVIFGQYRKDKNADAFGTRWADFCRFTALDDLADALGDDPERRLQFFERMHAGIAARLAAAPEQMRIPVAQLVLEKRQSG